MNGIRAEIMVHSPDGCPVAAVSEDTGERCTSVSWTSNGETVNEEFFIEGGPAVEVPEDSVPANSLTSIFRYGSKHAVRFERTGHDDCPCEHIESLGNPLRDVYARDGSLVIVFHAPDIEQLQEILQSVRSRYTDVSIHRLVQSNGEDEIGEFVFVDRSGLTNRQQEVLEVAHEMGYFDYPKGANAGEVADALDIGQSTFSEHLSAAQRKLLTNIIES